MPNTPVRPAMVLVVDDNMDQADSMARFLRVAVGHDVRVAYDGVTAVRLAKASPPEAVVCDIALPRLDGYAVARQIVAARPAKPLLIAVTAFSGDHPETRAREAGFDFYLAKPADPFVIERLICNHIRDLDAGGL